jgi:hypothetical protein
MPSQSCVVLCCVVVVVNESNPTYTVHTHTLILRHCQLQCQTIHESSMLLVLMMMKDDGHHYLLLSSALLHSTPLHCYIIIVSTCMARLCVLAAVLVVVATVGCLLSTPALGANSSEFVKPMANASRQCKGNAIPHQSINALVQSMSLSLSLSLSLC